MTNDLMARLRATADSCARPELHHGAADRIETLEAALREIGYGDIGHGDVWDIARRALEGKP